MNVTRPTLMLAVAMLLGATAVPVALADHHDPGVPEEPVPPVACLAIGSITWCPKDGVDALIQEIRDELTCTCPPL